MISDSAIMEVVGQWRAELARDGLTMPDGERRMLARHIAQLAGARFAARELDGGLLADLEEEARS